MIEMYSSFHFAGIIIPMEPKNAYQQQREQRRSISFISMRLPLVWVEIVRPRLKGLFGSACNEGINEITERLLIIE